MITSTFSILLVGGPLSNALAEAIAIERALGRAVVVLAITATPYENATTNVDELIKVAKTLTYKPPPAAASEPYPIYRLVPLRPRRCRTRFNHRPRVCIWEYG